MEMAARYPNEGNNVLTKWRWKQDTQMESEDGFGKLKLDHKDQKDAMSTG